MSVFLAEDLKKLAAYVPGEQPQDKRYVKLNTNENPFYPSRRAMEAITQSELENLRLYSDPDSRKLVSAIAKAYDVCEKKIVVGNGSDELLAFCFRAFGENGACFPDVTYGFYKVFADLFGVEKEIIPLKEDFTVDAGGFFSKNKLVVLANPNAQTGIFLPLSAVEEILAANRKSVVVIDEAYVDFGGESAVKLTEKYENLVVVQTFSKSRSLAGARVGFAIASEALAADLNRVRNSFNPYNVNRLSALLAANAVLDKAYFEESVAKVKKSREFTKKETGKARVYRARFQREFSDGGFGGDRRRKALSRIERTGNTRQAFQRRADKEFRAREHRRKGRYAQISGRGGRHHGEALMRKAVIERKTNETQIALTLCLDGGIKSVKTDCGFFNHMLELFAVHSGFGLEVECRGDSEVDFHHTVEDVGIALGQAFLSAIGDKRGIARYADIVLPMDEALVLCAVDISGRGYLNFERGNARRKGVRRRRRYAGKVCRGVRQRAGGGVFRRLCARGEGYASRQKIVRQKHASHHRGHFQSFRARSEKGRQNRGGRNSSSKGTL